MRVSSRLYRASLEREDRSLNLAEAKERRSFARHSMMLKLAVEKLYSMCVTFDNALKLVGFNDIPQSIRRENDQIILLYWNSIQRRCFEESPKRKFGWWSRPRGAAGLRWITFPDESQGDRSDRARRIAVLVHRHVDPLCIPTVDRFDSDDKWQNHYHQYSAMLKLVLVCPVPIDRRCCYLQKPAFDSEWEVLVEREKREDSTSNSTGFHSSQCSDYQRWQLMRLNALLYSNTATSCQNGSREIRWIETQRPVATSSVGQSLISSSNPWDLQDRYETYPRKRCLHCRRTFLHRHRSLHRSDSD